MEAWERFLEYRKQSKKPIRPASFEQAQKLLEGFGSQQLEVVEQTIAQGWQGLFPLKLNGEGLRKPYVQALSTEELEALEAENGRAS